MTKTKSSYSEKKKGKGTKEEGCTHYGNPKHTRETYFKLHGYPEWWQDLKKKREVDMNKSTGRTMNIESLVLSTNSFAENTIKSPNGSGNKGCSLSYSK